MLFFTFFFWLISLFPAASILLWVCCFGKKKPKKPSKKTTKKPGTVSDASLGTQTAVEYAGQTNQGQEKVQGGNNIKKKRPPLVPPLPPATNYPIVTDEKSTIVVTLDSTDMSRIQGDASQNRGPMPKSLHSLMTRRTQWEENEKIQKVPPLTPQQQKPDMDQHSEKIRPGSLFTEEDESETGDDSFVQAMLQQKQQQELQQDKATSAVDTAQVMTPTQSEKQQQSTEKRPLPKEPITAQSNRSTKKKAKRREEASTRTMEAPTVMTVISRSSDDLLPAQQNTADGSPTIRDKKLTTTSKDIQPKEPVSSSSSGSQ